jgi:uncharacterized membrane protein
MGVETFIGILVISAAATSIGIEIIKKLFDAFKWKYDSMVVAVVAAFIVGAVEVIIYAAQGKMPFNYLTAIYSICMGFVNMIGSTVGFDTVKKSIYALFGKVE